MFETASKWNIGAIAQEKAAKKRASWSAFEMPTDEEITKVADLLVSPLRQCRLPPLASCFSAPLASMVTDPLSLPTPAG